jgi:phosphoglycerate dehydrogenase-like enzyme
VSDPRFLVVSPPVDGWQPVPRASWYMHGGRRIRDIAETILGKQVAVEHLDWIPGPGFADALDARLPEADALVMSPWLGFNDQLEFGTARFDRAPNLRVIAGTFDFRLSWIDLDEAARRGVTLIDTSRTMTPTVAEFGVAITFALLRDIPVAIETVRDGSWTKAPMGTGSFVFRDLADCRIGLAGYGTINRHYRRFVRPYGCAVSTFDPFVSDEDLANDDVRRAGSMVELASGSDILIVAIPPTPTTLGVISSDVIDALAPGSLFVLLSRMAVVEQEALWRRVKAGELRAAVDVYDPEPPPEDAWFRRDPNVLPTPHIAGNTQFAHERCFEEACADATRVLGGEAPVNPATVRDKRLYDGTLTVVAE